jgi:hypothetical protein
MNCTRHRALFAIALCLAAFVSLGAQPTLPESPAVLTSLSKLANLSSEEAGLGLPVKVRGTITYCDRDRRTLFIQDGADAIAARIPIARENEDAELQPGQLVEVEGTTVRGRGKCTIRGKTPKVIGAGQIPEAFILDRNNPFTEKAESRRVRAQGWIPTVSTTGGRFSFVLVVRPGFSLDVTLNGANNPEAKDLPGSFVEVTGAFALRFNSSGQISGGRINVNDLGSIQRLSALAVAPIAEV